MLRGVFGHNGVQGRRFHGRVLHYGGFAYNDHALIGGVGIAGRRGLQIGMLILRDC